jgi:hypothetical protein
MVAHIMTIDRARWFAAFRDITNATNERTMVASALGRAGVGNNAPLYDLASKVAAAAAVLLANFDSIILDWAARFSVGGTHLNFFIVKQLPVLPPQVFLEQVLPDWTYAELIVPRVLELTYTAHDLEPFARDLGYEGPPFRWDEERRHAIRCELDAIFGHLYQLDRSDLEWILDAQPPSESFRTLKEKEVNRWGEYRTQRLVLEAFDRLADARAKGREFQCLVNPPPADARVAHKTTKGVV